MQNRSIRTLRLPESGTHAPPFITDDMLRTVLRRRAGGESVEQAHAGFATLQVGEVPGLRLARPDGASL